MCSKDTLKLWGGCFVDEASAVLRRLNDSLSIDTRLYREDIEGSRCWARELHLSGHLSEDDYLAIRTGLDTVEREIEEDVRVNGRLSGDDEDIHSAVERRLRAHAGDAALKLHTARSRNDQSATDTKMWMLRSISHLHDSLKNLISMLLQRSENEINLILPGYTHLQRAQPIRWSHFLLCHAWAFRDDLIRLKEQKSRVSRCPLGSGALAGCAFPIDRMRLAQDLGFEGITSNSMFAVSSRDHIIEFLNWSSLCGLHLSRLAEDLIIYSSQEFGFVRFSDKFSTGSSLMPQKRNPDGLELVRGAAGLLLGDTCAFSATLKGLPSTYNKDLQYDKEILFRSYDKLSDILLVTKGTVESMQVNGDKMLSSFEAGMFATDLAHALVRRGVPFRRAHHYVGTALRRSNALGVTLEAMPIEEYTAICSEFGSVEDLKSIFSWEQSVEQYTSLGGTALSAVQKQILELRDWIQNCDI